MPKITEEELVTIQLRLFKKDHDVLKSLFSGQVGVNKAIRTMIRTYVRQVQAKADAAIDRTEAALAAGTEAEAAAAQDDTRLHNREMAAAE